MFQLNWNHLDTLHSFGLARTCLGSIMNQIGIHYESIAIPLQTLYGFITNSELRTHKLEHGNSHSERRSQTQSSELRALNSEFRAQSSELRIQNSELKLRTQNSELIAHSSELRAQKSELRNQNSELRTQSPEGTRRATN